MNFVFFLSGFVVDSKANEDGLRIATGSVLTRAKDGTLINEEVRDTGLGEETKALTEGMDGEDSDRNFPRMESQYLGSTDLVSRTSASPDPNASTICRQGNGRVPVLHV